MTNVIIAGRFTKKPELRVTTTGTVLTNFSLACKGATKDEVDYIDCTAFDKIAELIVQYKDQGDLVLVAGRLKRDTWKIKDSTRKFTKVYVVVNEIEFLASKGERAAAPIIPQETNFEELGEEDELPF